MAELRLTKNVLSGSNEYTVAVDTANFEAGDSIMITVDNDIIIDDMLVLALGSTDVVVKLLLQYPTGATLRINPSPAGGTNVTSAAPYQMNDDADSRNMWFRIPKWTTLQILFAEIATSGALQVSVVGRG